MFGERIGFHISWVKASKHIDKIASQVPKERLKEAVNIAMPQLNNTCWLTLEHVHSISTLITFGLWFLGLPLWCPGLVARRALRTSAPSTTRLGTGRRLERPEASKGNRGSFEPSECRISLQHGMLKPIYRTPGSQNQIPQRDIRTCHLGKGGQKLLHIFRPALKVAEATLDDTSKCLEIFLHDKMFRPAGSVHGSVLLGYLHVLVQLLHGVDLKLNSFRMPGILKECTQLSYIYAPVMHAKLSHLLSMCALCGKVGLRRGLLCSCGPHIAQLFLRTIITEGDLILRSVKLWFLNAPLAGHKCRSRTGTQLSSFFPVTSMNVANKESGLEFC